MIHNSSFFSNVERADLLEEPMLCSDVDFGVVRYLIGRLGRQIDRLIDRYIDRQNLCFALM